VDVDLKRASSAAQAGRYAEAAQLYRGLVARSPDHPDATHFLGLCLVRLGKREEGRQLLERSVRLAPGNAMFRQNYAVVLLEGGDLAAAERELREIVVLEPANAGAANNLGYCLLERGDVEGAIAALTRSVAADARNPMAHNNLGNALRAKAEPRAALESYRCAVALAPGFADAHYNLAMALRDLGDARGALEAARAAMHCAPGQRPAWQLFAQLLAPLRFTAWDAGIAADCERLFSQTEVEVEACAEAVLSLVRRGPRGRLFLLLLEHALVADPGFEAELTALRRELLGAPVSLELACALAQQCFLNEYVWPVLEEETAVVSQLQGKTPNEVALIGMYRPIMEMPKPAGGDAAFERLWRRLVEEPRAEAALRGKISALTPVEDEVSRKVQAQYEANPYPRWHRAPAVGAFPLARMLRSLFPQLDAAGLSAPDAPDILIAGCGTGRHAAITAQLQPLGRVLAVDLSRSSLAYAMRRSGELGLHNVRFAQADLLRLGALEERFDLIECSGVLHHLSDPLAGWRVLLTLLKPGGYMKLGLYSERARRHIVAARALVEGLEVREARERLLALPEDHPARNVTALRDFYSASGARDLILHVQEQRFTLTALEKAIAELGVEFLGFELADKSGPPRGSPNASASFAEWDAFEAAHPDTFDSMYQFWIRR
jgi:Flp pilus assembly protein TadD/SAM-dependent methyltransferase